MDDSHGKGISLQYVTVKVPGQKPRGSRGTQSAAPVTGTPFSTVAASATATTTAAVASSNGGNGVVDASSPVAGEFGCRGVFFYIRLSLTWMLMDLVFFAIVAGFPSKEKRADKVLLTAYEILKEPVTRVLGGDSESVPMQNALNGDAIKSETPSVKKRHRRMKSSSNKTNDLEGTSMRDLT